MDTIESLRQEIDQVHKEIHALLLRRRDLTLAVWEIKKAQGMPFYSAEREEQIIQDFLALNASQEKDPQFEELLKGVINALLREYETYLKSKFPSK